MRKLAAFKVSSIRNGQTGVAMVGTADRSCTFDGGDLQILFGLVLAFIGAEHGQVVV